MKTVKKRSQKRKKKGSEPKNKNNRDKIKQRDTLQQPECKME